MAIRWPGLRTSAKGVRSDARYRQSAEVSSATHGDRTVLLDLRSEQFFSLDDVGHRIWELLGRRASVDEIVLELVAIYDAPEADIRTDVETFITTLVRDRLAVEV
jgi:Coenzyme PQQ synthesis protein D (PqqD)